MHIKSRFLATQTNDEYPWLERIILLFYVPSTYYLLFKVTLSSIFGRQHAAIIGVAKIHRLLIFVLVLAIGPHLPKLLFGGGLIRGCLHVHGCRRLDIHALASHFLFHFAVGCKLAVDELRIVF